MDMIERVAMALFEAAKTYEPENSDNPDCAWPAMARAAIEAMREPTQDMLGAWRCVNDMIDLRMIYQAMLDAALNEEE